MLAYRTTPWQLHFVLDVIARNYCPYNLMPRLVQAAHFEYNGSRIESLTGDCNFVTLDVMFSNIFF